MELIKDIDLKANTGTNSFDILSEIEKCRIRATDDIGRANYVMKIRNTKKLSRGNISSWIGKAKSKKTFCLTMLVAAMCSNKSIDEVINPMLEGVVLYFDTEQSPYDVQQVVRRVKAIAGDERNLYMYGLRPYSPEERVTIIREVLNLKGSESSLVVIDGVRDLIYDINNAIESTTVVTDIMKWSQVYDTHIACVLHSNKADGNARGHIGTELTNKSETVIKITRDEKDINISHVEEQYGRGRGFEAFSFQINKKTSLPEIVQAVIGGDFDDDNLPF